MVSVVRVATAPHYNTCGPARNTEPKCGCRVAVRICKHPLRVGTWVDTLHETVGRVFVEYLSVGRYSDLLGLGRYGGPNPIWGRDMPH
jgi:hypothetical protein